MEDHVDVHVDVVEVSHQLFVVGVAHPHVQEGRDQLAVVVLVGGDMPLQLVLQDWVSLDLAGDGDKLHEDLVDLAWPEVDQKQTADVTKERDTLNSVLGVHIHKDELKLVFAFLSEDVELKAGSHLLDLLGELVEVLINSFLNGSVVKLYCFRVDLEQLKQYNSLDRVRHANSEKLFELLFIQVAESRRKDLLMRPLKAQLAPNIVLRVMQAAVVLSHVDVGRNQQPYLCVKLLHLLH